MSIAHKIHSKLGKKVELRLIKKVMKAYEDIKLEDYLTADEVLAKIDKRHPNGFGSAINLKAYRQRALLTQKQLADLAGMAQSNISEIEKGIRPLGLNVAKNLAKALKCHYKDLLEG